MAFLISLFWIMSVAPDNPPGTAAGRPLACGVFLDYEDYARARPSYAVPCRQEGYALWPAGFFAHRDLRVHLPDTALFFPGEAVWGYIDHQKRLHRIYGRKHYRVIAQDGLVLYLLNSPTRIRYFFSKTLRCEPRPLRKRELLRAFQDEPAVYARLQAMPEKYFLAWVEPQQMYLLNTLVQPPKGGLGANRR
jgi:hypothetical protein